ncbi:uncharacterized protein LOC109503926 [Harpegnathos saltator]|uniref:uncharacterized protein LOC109503926 n=1 Tax=Harpegnathos saltator TaxID=610380 RepID=UPI000DBEEA68|nr:uncharacterized protein LOC109503926 [Harpegnathos saltator]
MSDDLLPEWLNLFLDDFETSLCLPILMVMILCTAQFVFNHLFDIAHTIYRNAKLMAAEGAPKQNNMMGKLKGILTTFGGGNAGTTAIPSSPSPAVGAEEEWDYCEDYCELE